MRFLIVILLVLSGCGILETRDKYAKRHSIQLNGNGSACSGEQIEAPSGNTYILSAGHCAGLAVNGSIQAITEDGNILMRRVIAEDDNSDLLLLEGIPNMPGLKIAKNSKIWQHVSTYTHGKRLATYKTDGFIIQKKRVQIPLFAEGEKPESECQKSKLKYISTVTMFGEVKMCLLDVEEEYISARVFPGSSGGMVVNDSGELIGVVSATDGDFGLMVPLKDVKAFINGY